MGPLHGGPFLYYMRINKRNLNLNNLFFLLTLLGIIFSFTTITTYPFVHSDEIWLADLSDQIVSSGEVKATESFFRLTPRYPHAIKTLYHLIQGIFLSFDFNIFFTRLPSFLTGMASLYVLHLIMKKKTPYNWLASALLAWNIQFFYSSHFGRQEIFIFFLLILGLYIIECQFPPSKEGLLLGLFTSMGLFIHPNIFIVALALGILISYRIIHNSLAYKTSLKKTVASPLIYTLLLAIFALLVITFSFRMDADFISNYSNFGSQQGTALPLWLKFRRFPRFITKMYIQAAGTYYLPNIKLSIISGLGLLIIHPLGAILSKKKQYILESFEYPLIIASISLGLIIIGKYSPPSILFLILPVIMAAGVTIRHIKRKGTIGIILILVIIQMGSSTLEIMDQMKFSYQDYSTFITSTIPHEDQVLGNLNMGFAHNVKNLHPIRDFEYLKDSGKSMAEYIDDEYIKWIVWPDEMDIVYQERPLWNNLYGNITPYYQELKSILNSAVTVKQGYFPVYGMRIIPYQHRKGGNITIYYLP